MSLKAVPKKFEPERDFTTRIRYSLVLSSTINGQMKDAVNDLTIPKVRIDLPD